MKRDRTPSSFIMMTLEEPLDLMEFMDAAMRRAGNDRGLLARVTLSGSVRYDLDTLSDWGRTQSERGAPVHAWLCHAGQQGFSYPEDGPFLTPGQLGEALEDIRENTCRNLALTLSVEDELMEAVEDLLMLARDILMGFPEETGGETSGETSGETGGMNGGMNGGMPDDGIRADPIRRRDSWQRGEPLLQACLRNLPEDDLPEENLPSDDLTGGSGYSEWLELRLHLDREGAPGMIEQVLLEQQEAMGDGILEDHELMHLEVDEAMLGELNQN